MSSDVLSEAIDRMQEQHRAEVGRLVRDVKTTGALARRAPVTEQVQFKAAAFLQDFPGREVTVAEVAAGSNLSRKQAGNILQRFSTERTDVERVRKGAYRYTPGKGVGIKPTGQRKLVTDKGAPKRTGRPQSPYKSPYAEPAPLGTKPGWVPAPNDSGVLVKQPEMFFEIPGLKTRDGRRVVRGWDGVPYAITELG